MSAVVKVALEVNPAPVRIVLDRVARAPANADLAVYAANPLAAAELQQLQNIGAVTLSAAQWGYLGASVAFGGGLLALANAAALRTAAGLVIGTDVQAYDAQLAAIAGAAPSAGDIHYWTSATAIAAIASTAFGRARLADADAAAARTALGVVIGADVQSYDADTAKTDVAQTWSAAQTFANTGLKVRDTDASHSLIVKPGSNLTAERTLTLTTGDADRTLDMSAASVTISAAGAALIDDADASAQRTTLGLGTMATQASSSYAALAGATFTGTITISNTDPIVQFYDSDAATDEKRYFFSGSGANLLYQFVNDAANAANTAFSLVRSGYTASSANFGCQIRPTTDNSFNLGTASFRWATVYAGTGTINTSDASEKTALEPIPPAVKRAVRAIVAQAGVFQWLAAVAAKGADRARLHAGVTAQAVEAAFAAEGLDPARWGVFCADPVIDSEERFNPERGMAGTILTPRRDAKGAPAMRLGVRYDQLLVLAIAVLAEDVAALRGAP